MYKSYFVSAIIAAAGMSNRMGSKINKQFIHIDSKPILAHAIEKFETDRFVDEIVVVCREEEIEYCRREIVKKYGFKKVMKIVKGGKERQDSVYNGLMALDKKCDMVLIHDGARPFVKVESIEAGIKGVEENGACIIGVPVKDTIKLIKDECIIENTPDRRFIWAAQTPQCFFYDIIMKAYRQAVEDQFIGTDDGMLVERLGYKVKMIMGDYNNIKITTPEDLIIAESIVKEKDFIYMKDLIFRTR